MAFTRRFYNLVLAGSMFTLTVFLVGAGCGEQVAPAKIGEVTQAPEATAEATEPATEAPTAAPAQTKQSTEAPTAAPAQTKQSTEVPTAASRTESYSVGDVMDISDFVLVVLGWEMPTDDIFRPDAGNMYVAVELLFVNQSDSPATVSTLLQMALKDSTDRQFTLDLGAQTASKSGALDGELAAGERIRGKIGFQVPEDAAGLVFVFDPSIIGTGRAFVALD